MDDYFRKALEKSKKEVAQASANIKKHSKRFDELIAEIRRGL